MAKPTLPFLPDLILSLDENPEFALALFDTSFSHVIVFINGKFLACNLDIYQIPPQTKVDIICIYQTQDIKAEIRRLERKDLLENFAVNKNDIIINYITTDLLYTDLYLAIEDYKEWALSKVFAYRLFDILKAVNSISPLPPRKNDKDKIAADIAKQKAYQKAYRLKHKDKAKAAQKKYHSLHLKEDNEKCKAYNSTHKVEVAAYQKAYRSKNKDKLKAYQLKNKDILQAYQKKYREKKKTEKKEGVIEKTTNTISNENRNRQPPSPSPATKISRYF